MRKTPPVPVIGYRRDGRPIYLVAGGAPITVRVGDTERTIEEARARLEELETEMRAVHEEAGDGDLDDEQRSTWEQLDTECQELAVATRKAERQQRLAESRSKWSTVQVGGKKDDPFTDDVRTVGEQQALTRARQVADDKELGGHLRADQREQLDKLLRTRNGNLDGDLIARQLLATQNPHYRSAFQKYASNSQAYTNDEARAIEAVRQLNRAASVGTTTAGGFAVPVKVAA